MIESYFAVGSRSAEDGDVDGFSPGGQDQIADRRFLCLSLEYELLHPEPVVSPLSGGLVVEVVDELAHDRAERMGEARDAVQADEQLDGGRPACSLLDKLLRDVQPQLLHRVALFPKPPPEPARQPVFSHCRNVSEARQVKQKSHRLLERLPSPRRLCLVVAVRQIDLAVRQASVDLVLRVRHLANQMADS